MSEYTEYFENFWTKYGREEKLSNTRKGSKYTAYQSWIKIMGKWASREHVTEDIEKLFAQACFRGYENIRINRGLLKQKNEFCPPLPMVSTWLNQWRMDQETDIPSGELRRRDVEKRCSMVGCDNAVIGRSYEGGYICRVHDLQEWGNQNREDFKKLLAKHPKLAGESWRDWSWRTLQQFPIGKELLKRFNQRNRDSGQTCDATPS